MDEDAHARGPESAQAAAAHMFASLLAETHLTRPDDLAAVLADKALLLGVEQLVVYLVDYEQAHLVPVPSPHARDRSVLRVEGTLGGRAFATLEIQDVPAGPEGVRRLWMPLLDGTDRIGALEMCVPDPGTAVAPEMVRLYERFAHLSAQMVISKGFYGDAFEFVRRRRPMTVAAEMQWNLLPPLVFATEGLVLAGMLEPAYDVGGDSFDYAVNGSVAHLAVFDAMGHGLGAAITVSLAVAAYRNARRRLLDLPGTYAAVDEILLAQFAGERYVTGILARLDLGSGTLTWVSAGHPPPLLLRDGRLVKTLDVRPFPPLGLQVREGPPPLGHESLQPGDRVLLYTDGLIEARTSDGSFFTAERLAAFLEHQAAAGLPAPETLRRLRHAVMAYQKGHLQDDATALLMEWRRGREHALQPRPVCGAPGAGERRHRTRSAGLPRSRAAATAGSHRRRVERQVIGDQRSKCARSSASRIFAAISSFSPARCAPLSMPIRPRNNRYPPSPARPGTGPAPRRGGSSPPGPGRAPASAAPGRSRSAPRPGGRAGTTRRARSRRVQELTAI